ncbi:MAG TPA: VanZ family protein [Cyclobacteriaceae bacterium]|nr:VanZ family protein [Cyclobacteriaceae bacterium]
MTLFPGDYISPPGHFLSAHLDKIIHYVLFLIFAILCYYSLPVISQSGNINLISILIILAISLVFGGVIEFLQRFIPGRGYELADILVDGAGTLTGLLFLFLKKIL